MHMVELRITTVEDPTDFSRMVLRFFIRRAVLLKPVNTIFDLGTPHLREQRARLYTADVHNGRIQSLRKNA